MERGARINLDGLSRDSEDLQALGWFEEEFSGGLADVVVLHQDLLGHQCVFEEPLSD